MNKADVTPVCLVNIGFHFSWVNRSGIVGLLDHQSGLSHSPTSRV
jgi:hypothetical protein